MDDRIPRPFPNKSTFKYKPVFESPPLTDDVRRPVDDFMPRAQIKKQFSEGKLQNEDQILDFSKKYIVSVELVTKYIEHLKHLHSQNSQNN